MLSLHANSWQPVSELPDPTSLSSLMSSDRLTMHLTCEPCHRAKTACDGLQPCARCVRLQRTQVCVPHQRKRSRRNQPRKPHAAPSSSELPTANIKSQQLEAARQNLAAAFGSSVERAPAAVGMPELVPLNYPTLHSTMDSAALFQRSLSYESTPGMNANIDYPTTSNSAAATMQESIFAANPLQNVPPPTNRSRDDSAAFWEPRTPTDFLGLLQQQSQQRMADVATPHERGEKQMEPSPNPILATAATREQSSSTHATDAQSQGSSIGGGVPPPPPNSESSSAASKNRKIQGWEDRVLKGPEPLDPAAFEPLQAPSFQKLLRRELESGRMSPYVLAYHLTSMSEILCFEDWKRLVLLMPIPVPPCSTRAGFSSSMEFRNWWIAQRLRCRALAKSQVAANMRASTGSSATTPGSSGSSTTGSTAAKPTSEEAGSSEEQLIAPHLCFLPMLFDVDYSDSPFLCVEDEQMLAGLVPRIVMLHQATVSQPLQLSLIIRSTKQLSSRAEKERSRQNKHRKKETGASASSSSTNSTSRSRSRSRSHSRSHSSNTRSSSCASSSASSSRSASPPSSRGTHRRHHRKSSRKHDDDSDRSRSRSRSRSRHRSSKSSSRHSRDRSETSAFRRELQSRLKAFESRKSASYFDTLRTKHSMNCTEGKAGQETEQYVRDALAAAAANERAIELSEQENTTLDRDAVPSSDFSSIGLARCGCPCIVQRRMHIQVNRAFERVAGWSQKEVRGLLIQCGQVGMQELMGNNRDPDTELYASFVVLLCGHHDFCLPYFTPLATRWGGSVQAQMSVKLIVSDNELDGWICTWTVDPQQKNKGTSPPPPTSQLTREMITTIKALGEQR